MSLNIQLATSKHLDQIVELIQQTSLWLKTKGINQWSGRYPISRLEKEVLDQELFVILDQSEQLMGSLSLSNKKGELWPAMDQPAFYLNRLVLSQKYAGQNLGSKAIEWAQNYCRRQGICVLRLNCDKKNPFLPDYYLRQGFHRTGEFFYSEWGMTFLLFEMDL